jgi:NTP pyrophosphatase (non-canonical NTP hydrolase)
MNKQQKIIAKFLKDRGWEKHGIPANYAKSIAIEAGELLELYQWDNPTYKQLKKDRKKFAETKKELADVLIYCLDFCVMLGVDVEVLIEDKMALNAKKYPLKKVKNNMGEYYKIKRRYRTKK